MAVETTVLDRVIAWLSPGWGRRRVMERAWAGVVKGFYDGAGRGRRGASIRRKLGDANAITGRELATVRRGSRDLHRNNAHVRRGTEAIVANTVGTGIRPTFVREGSRDEALQALARRHLSSTECDSDGRLTYFGLQAAALWGAVEGGEVLVRRRRRRPADGLTVPVQFQLLESEYLDSSRDGPTRRGGVMIQGVEFDAIGRRRGYWLFDRHPESSSGRATSQFVPEADVIHVYRIDRPGQVRGVPWITPVMLRIADYGDAVDAQVMRYKVAACYAAFISSPFDLPRGRTETSQTGELITQLEPGIVDRLAPGEEITFADPPGPQNYDEFAGVTLREIAAGRGISYEMMTGDLRGVNFSSGKMGRVEAQRNVEMWQQHLLIPVLCERLTRWWLEAAELTGASIDGVDVRHTPPAREMIDPPREGRAERDMIRSGQMTLFQALRARGLDPLEHLAEYADGLRTLDDLDIIVDSDPRQRTSSGSAIMPGVGAGGGDGVDGRDPSAIVGLDDFAQELADLSDLVHARNGSAR